MREVREVMVGKGDCGLRFFMYVDRDIIGGYTVFLYVLYSRIPKLLTANDAPSC